MAAGLVMALAAGDAVGHIVASLPAVSMETSIAVRKALGVQDWCHESDNRRHNQHRPLCHIAELNPCSKRSIVSA